MQSLFKNLMSTKLGEQVNADLRQRSRPSNLKSAPLENETRETQKHPALAHMELSIHMLRGERIILDTDFARVYGVPTFRLYDVIKRNRDRFPEDFLFQLTQDEMADTT